eukprot:3609816-Rhodomonas_salina.1
MRRARHAMGSEGALTQEVSYMPSLSIFSLSSRKSTSSLAVQQAACQHCRTAHAQEMRRGANLLSVCGARVATCDRFRRIFSALMPDPESAKQHEKP